MAFVANRSEERRVGKECCTYSLPAGIERFDNTRAEMLGCFFAL